MSNTTTQANTPREELNQGNANTMGDIAARMKLGTMLTPIKVTVGSLSAASSFDITTTAFFSKITASLGLPPGTTQLPAIRSVGTLRVTAVGGGATGPRIVTDAGGTAVAPGATGNSGVPGVALLSDDGKTLTFEGTVTGFVLEYSPRSAVDMTGAYP